MRLLDFFRRCLLCFLDEMMEQDEAVSHPCGEQDAVGKRAKLPDFVIQIFVAFRFISESF